ncbi:MAG TPA: ATP-binding cassette domain-containing protein, partial [Burkholderiales bacterium]|nr:ATP-binding cassette domain-containing protein [Burkholderiales bacterium]
MTMSAPAMLTVNGIEVIYNHVILVLKGVSLTVREGGIVALLGANGAGKTTTLRVLSTLLQPDRGSTRIGGKDVVREPLAVRAQLGVVSDARGLYPRLTARENIAYFAQLHGLAPRSYARRLEELAEALGLAPLLDRRAAGFSAGERMKVALARALIHDPQHVVLDEPTAALDVLSTRAMRRLLGELRDRGKCV